VSDVSPWSDKGWVKAKRPWKRSPCCKDAVWGSLADGVLIGTCARCSQYVSRIQPQTGVLQIPAQWRDAISKLRSKGGEEKEPGGNPKA
jgi:hypothetical protein